MSHATRSVSAPETVTFEEYMAMPLMEARHEIIDGVIVMSPAPMGHHQLILINLIILLVAHVKARNLGTIIAAPFDVLIRKQPRLRTRQPDRMFYSNARMSREDIRQAAIAECGPDLAIEVRSPADTSAGWDERLRDYASVRILEVWRVLPDSESVEVLQLRDDAYEQIAVYRANEAVRSLVLPELELPVAAIFE